MRYPPSERRRNDDCQTTLMKSVLRHSKVLRLVSTGVCVFSLLANNAEAAVFYWDPNGTASVGGDGIWNTTSLQWSSTSTQSGTLVAWNTANAADFCAGPTAAANQGTFTI